MRSVMAPRAGLLRNPPERAYSCRDSNPRWGILQGQVTGTPTQRRFVDTFSIMSSTLGANVSRQSIPSRGTL
jgi:hypothetical protein